MMFGQVTDTSEAIIKLAILTPDCRQFEIQVVIDTGFTDFLALPSTTIAQRGLLFMDTTECQLADGSMVAMRSFLASVQWHNAAREILVLAAEGEPLIGMSMLSGSKITMEVISRGKILIEKIESP